jgi:hypothetical protein
MDASMFLTPRAITLILFILLLFIIKIDVKVYLNFYLNGVKKRLSNENLLEHRQLML